MSRKNTLEEKENAKVRATRCVVLLMAHVFWSVEVDFGQPRLQLGLTLRGHRRILRASSSSSTTISSTFCWFSSWRFLVSFTTFHFLALLNTLHVFNPHFNSPPSSTVDISLQHDDQQRSCAYSSRIHPRHTLTVLTQLPMRNRTGPQRTRINGDENATRHARKPSATTVAPTTRATHPTVNVAALKNGPQPRSALNEERALFAR